MRILSEMRVFDDFYKSLVFESYRSSCAELAIKMAPKVAQLMATALEKDQDWEQQQIENFTTIASGYLLK